MDRPAFPKINPWAFLSAATLACVVGGNLSEGRKRKCVRCVSELSDKIFAESGQVV